MKLFYLIGFALVSTSAVANEELSALLRKHRNEIHEEQKKWAGMETDCQSKHSNRHDVKSPDYDAYFKCTEAIADAKAALEEKQNEEACSKFNISCKKK